MILMIYQDEDDFSSGDSARRLQDVPLEEGYITRGIVEMLYRTFRLLAQGRHMIHSTVRFEWNVTWAAASFQRM